MQRKFLLNLFLVILVNLMIKPLYLFGIDRTFQNAVGSENYGLFYSLFNLTFILSILIDPGITNFNNRHIAQHQQLLSKYFSNIIIIKGILSLLFLFVLGIWIIFMNNYSAVEIRMLMLLGISQILNSYVLYNRSNLSGLHLFKTDTIISVLDKLIMVFLVAGFILSPALIPYLSIQLFCLLQTLSFLITAIVSFIAVKAHTNNTKFKFNILVFKLVLKESFPYAILISLMVIYAKADTVMLKYLLVDGNLQVGIYAAAYRLIDAANMIAVLFAGLLYPIFARQLKLKENINPLVKTGVSLLVFPACLISAVVFSFKFQIMTLLYTQHIQESALILGFLIGTLLASCISYIFGTLLTANGNITLLNKIALIGAITNLVLNFIFIPKFGVMASAAISLLTFSIVAFLQIYFAMKLFSLKFNWIGIFKLLLGEIIILFLSYWLKNQPINFYCSILIASVTAILFLLTARLVSLKEIITILKSER